jgi:uncharacterized membrane protein
MLHSLIGASDFGSTALEWIEVASLVIEILAVTIIIIAIFYAMGRFLLRAALRRQKDDGYHELKISLGKSLLLGLEVLVAADVVRTVALEATLESVAVLGLLVLIRTFLSWSLLVEMEGRWPWQSLASVHEGKPPAGEPGQATVIHSGGITCQDLHAQ